MTTTRWRPLLAALLLIPALRARAGNDDEILLGNDAALTGGAVVASVNDGSALWYNPAGLARASKDSIDVGASAFTLRRYDAPSLIRLEGGSGGDADFTELITIPSALTYLRRFGDRVVGGLGLFASHFNDAALRSSSSIEGPGGEARIAFLYSGRSARYHLIGGVGVQLAPRWTFGVSLSGDYQDETDVFQLAITARDAVATRVALLNSSYVQQKTLGFHLRAGTTFALTDALRLGLSVESPGFYFYRSGRATELSIAADHTEAEPTLEADTPDVRTSSVSMGLYAPVRVRFGGTYAVAGGTVSLEADVQPRLRDTKVDVDRQFTWNVRAGARFPVSERYRLGAGFFTDRAPERVDRVGAGRTSFYGGTVGAQYENVHLLAGQNKQGEPRGGLVFSSTIALRYAYGSGKEAGTELLTTGEGSTSERAVQVTVHELTLHLGSGIYF